MKNLLFVSIAFPPKNDPECIQTGKYFNYLTKLNQFNIDVVTSKSPTLFMPYDDYLRKYLKGVRQLIEIRIFENKYLNFILNKIFPNTINLPDSKFTFIYGFRRIINKLKEKPDVIYSRSFPMSSAYLASKLASYYGVPWIMHLSDPWIDSPLNNYTIRTKKKLEKKEKELFEKAVFINVTSTYTREMYIKKYPSLKNKFKYFPNVFDPNDIQQNINLDYSKLRFVYTGGLSNKRSVDCLLDVISSINQLNKNILHNVEFIFAGQFDRKNRALINRTKIKSIYNKGLLSYFDSISLQRTGLVLLVIEAKFENEENAIFFPSKLLDYIITNKHIIAITNYNSQIRTILKNSNAKCFDHSEIKSLQKHILYLIKEFNLKNFDAFKSNSNINNEYSADLNAQKLSLLIQSTI